jgi:GntR family transcriptional regulator
VLPFSITIRSGRPLHDQIVFAVTKAVITGQLRPGDRFPSVRTLSQELKINPNTAMKVIAALVEQGLLDARPGIGTSVAAWRPLSGAGRRAALADGVDRLVVEAKRLGLDLSDVLDAVRKEWR